MTGAKPATPKLIDKKKLVDILKQCGIMEKSDFTGKISFNIHLGQIGDIERVEKLR